MRVYLYISSFLMSLVTGLFTGAFEELSRLWILPVSFVAIFIAQYVVFFVFLCYNEFNRETIQRSDINSCRNLRYIRWMRYILLTQNVK